jgi:hypothetical protein
MSKKPRVVVPANPKELLELSQDVYIHHQALGNASPLLTMEAPNWETIGSSVSPAIELEKRAKELEKELKNVYQQRDLLLQTIDTTVKASRDLLLGAYSQNPARLGDFGFTVLESAAPKKDKPV